jgi:hypothetical protein
MLIEQFCITYCKSSLPGNGEGLSVLLIDAFLLKFLDGNKKWELFGKDREKFVLERVACAKRLRQKFLQEHPLISARTPKDLEKARYECCTPEVFQAYFDSINAAMWSEDGQLMEFKFVVNADESLLAGAGLVVKSQQHFISVEGSETARFMPKAGEHCSLVAFVVTSVRSRLRLSFPSPLAQRRRAHNTHTHSSLARAATVPRDNDAEAVAHLSVGGKGERGDPYRDAAQARLQRGVYRERVYELRHVVRTQRQRGSKHTHTHTHARTHTQTRARARVHTHTARAHTRAHTRTHTHTTHRFDTVIGTLKGLPDGGLDNLGGQKVMFIADDPKCHKLSIEQRQQLVDMGIVYVPLPANTSHLL